MKTILYSDREETTDAQQERKDPVINFTPEANETPAVPKQKKNNNAIIWAVVAVVVVLIIIGLLYYMNLKRQKNGNPE